MIRTKCSLANGSINATVTGGVAPYTYLWSDGQTTEDLADILAGDYTLTVTGANGCTRTVSITVGNEDPPITLTGTTQPNTSCNSGTGSIDLTPSPGTPPAPLGGYTYTWSEGSTTQDLSGLLPGSYTVTVSTGGTCTATATYNVADNPNRPVPAATPTQSTCNLANGSIDANASGGVPPYTYEWSNGATTQDITNVTPGSYTLTVTGANGCTQTISVNVGNNDPTITLSAATTPNTACVGGTGSIDLTPTPAVPPAPLGAYTYNWSNGETTQDLANLPSGNYIVTVSMGGTCTAVGSYNIVDNASIPSPTATPTQSLCDLPNGSIDANASGGVPPYTYAWSNGETTQDITNLAPGGYTLTVTGANGCTRSISVNVSNNNPSISLSATTVANTTCNGGNGSINLTPNPAIPPAPLGGYTYTWSNGETTQDLANLPAGSYTVTVSAGGSCTAVGTYNVADNPNQPVPTATPTQSTCDLPNGSIDASVTGGVAPYTYAWSNGETTQDLANVAPGSQRLHQITFCNCGEQ
jgi:VCBS repeat-containing protein